MPNKCVVPGCCGRGGFCFPSDTELSLKWQAAIKREGPSTSAATSTSTAATSGSKGALWKPSIYSTICDSHFKPEDFKECYEAEPKKRKRRLKDNAIPSVFSWSAPTPSTSAAAATIETEGEDGETEGEDGAERERSQSDDPTNDINLGGEEEVDDADILVEIVQTGPVECSTQTEHSESVDQGAQTRETGAGADATRSTFSIKNIKDNPNAVKFYTSFVSYKHFCYALHCLGPAAYELDYKSRSLDTEDEFFLFMVKIRLNREDEDLSYQFGISRSTVHRVFHTWLQFVFFHMKDVVKFIPKETVEQTMPKDFKAKFPSTRVILDATEIEIGNEKGNIRITF